MNDIIFSVDRDAYTSPCRSPSSSKIDKYWKKTKNSHKILYRLSPFVAVTLHGITYLQCTAAVTQREQILAAATETDAVNGCVNTYGLR